MKINLPPIDHFYCSPLQQWINSCKPFGPTHKNHVNEIDFIPLQLSDKMVEYIQFNNDLLMEVQKDMEAYFSLINETLKNN